MIKPGANPHIRLAERKGYGTSKAVEKEKFVAFDKTTLENTKNIIEKIVQIKNIATMNDAEEFSPS